MDTDYRKGSVGSYREGWDWKRMIPVKAYVKLSLIGLPGWNLSPEGDELTRWCHFYYSRPNPSRSTAIAIDDWCLGMFYYADKTGGIPFLDEGDEYASIFSFQLLTDFRTFAVVFPDLVSPENNEKAKAFMKRVYGGPNV